MSHYRGAPKPVRPFPSIHPSTQHHMPPSAHPIIHPSVHPASHLSTHPPTSASTSPYTFFPSTGRKRWRESPSCLSGWESRLGFTLPSPSHFPEMHPLPKEGQWPVTQAEAGAQCLALGHSVFILALATNRSSLGWPIPLCPEMRRPTSQAARDFLGIFP